MAGQLSTRVKDLLARLGVEGGARDALWWLRYHRHRLTGEFVMDPVHLPGVDARPRTVLVPPASIAHISAWFVWDRYYRGALVFDGNWDEVIKRPRRRVGEPPPEGFHDLGGYPHHTVVDMFVRGRDYRETAEYAHLSERIERGGRPRGCSSLGDLDRHFEELVEDHQRMKEGEFGRYAADGRLAPHQVNTFVDRHGGVIHYAQGFHQLLMAELLGLERIPIRVRAVHAAWLLPEIADSSGDVPAAVAGGIGSLGQAPPIRDS
jgi:hypothetical protein